MPLITLTRNQFLKKRPKGDYQAYRRYLDTERAPRPHAPPTGKLVDLPMDPNAVNKALLANVMSGALNPKQQRQQAVRGVNDAIKGALGELRGTTAAAQKQATDQARAFEEFAKVLAEARRSDAGYVTDLYRDAGADQARFASGITGAVGDAARSDAAAQQADIAAATGQTAGYHGPSPTDLQSVGYYLGGQLPSARLAENAAYAGTDALRQGLASAARLGIEGAGMRGKAIDLQAELARERAKLIAGKPKAIREAMDALSDDQRSNLATLANVLYLQNTQAKTTADLLGTYQGQPTINTYRDASGKLRQYNPDQYRVKTSKDGSQFLVPLPNPPSTADSDKNKEGLTPGQVKTQTRMREQAIQTKRSAMLAAAQNPKGPLFNKPAIDLGEFTPPVRKTYAQAKAYLMTNFANDLIKQYGGEKARILRMVEEVLASAGFKKKATTPAKPTGAPSLFGMFNPGFPGIPKSPSR